MVRVYIPEDRRDKPVEILPSCECVKEETCFDFTGIRLLIVCCGVGGAVFQAFLTHTLSQSHIDIFIGGVIIGLFVILFGDAFNKILR